MPKMKTKRAAAKRFSITGTGKVRRYKAGRRHNLASKTSKRKRGLRISTVARSTETEAIKRMIPYK